MSIIAIANTKGGSGKTTLTFNLGAALAAQGRRVLLVDFDPQCSLTLLSGRAFTAVPYPIYAALDDSRAAQPVDLAAAILPLAPNLDLIASTPKLHQANVELVSALRAEILLKKVLAGARSQYDDILVDTMPYIGILLDNALMAADSVLIPMPPEFMAMESLKQLLQRIRVAQQPDLNERLGILGMVFSITDLNLSIHNQAIAHLTQVYAPQMRVFTTVIKDRVKLKEAAASKESILTYAPRDPSADAFRALAQEVIDAQA